ncbi:protein max isoform X3 [Leguminivora glycinivorella]|uniref:protein max isoform X3 n=1 Tax=Leguminivora glycinivorella TaxID=1035111 RepID=UPI00201058F6|nr:protein max isoform X3 [Leguminivora glycinivorella]
MMSDDDRDIDIESDAEKRAHHNALERKRRDHIKDSFTSLRDSVPALQGEKVVCKASRAQILKKAAEYIMFMRRKNNSHQQDIDDLRRQNNLLESQIRALEKARATGNYMDAHELGLEIKSEGSSRDTDSSDGEGTTRRVKKLKINGVNVS